MSITKISTLSLEREFHSMFADQNETVDLEFGGEGLDIGYDTLSWDDIKAAYLHLFGKELN